MVLDGVTDPEMSERDFIDLCCRIGESMDFCICYTKTIVEIRRFHFPDAYTNTFSFRVEFPENRGTKAANRRFVAEKMAHLLEVVLRDSLPVGLENVFDPSGQKTFAIIKVLPASAKVKNPLRGYLT